MSQPQADPSPQSDPPDAAALPRLARGLELRTLIVLRWLAVAGQMVAVLTASLVLDLGLPIGACLVVIQPRETTLTDKDIDALSAKVVAAAGKIGATLRA